MMKGISAVETGRGGVGFWFAGFRVGALLGIPTCLLVVAVVGNIWRSCDIGVNSAANTGALIFLTPVVWISAVFSWWLVYGAFGRVNRASAATLGGLCNLLIIWLFVSWLGFIDSYPSPECPGGVPDWWPAFMPT